MVVQHRCSARSTHVVDGASCLVVATKHGVIKRCEISLISAKILNNVKTRMPSLQSNAINIYQKRPMKLLPDIRFGKTGAAKMQWLQMWFLLRMRISMLIFAGHASNESAIALLGTWAPRLPKLGTPQRATIIVRTGIRHLARLSCLSDPPI